MIGIMYLNSSGYSSVMRSAFKLISFDAWNTLLRLDLISKAISERLGERSGLSSETVCKLMIMVYEEVRMEWILREVKDSDLLQVAQSNLAKKLKISLKLVKEAVSESFEALDAEEVLYPEVVEVLKDLSKSFHLAVVSNVLYWPGSLTRGVLERAGVSKLFEAQLYADEVGVSKPDRRIFLMACEACGVKVEDAIHVGDSVLEDVGGALSSGMKAVLIRRDMKDPKLVKEAGLAIIPDLSHLRRIISLI